VEFVNFYIMAIVVGPLLQVGQTGHGHSVKRTKGQSDFLHLGCSRPEGRGGGGQINGENINYFFKKRIKIEITLFRKNKIGRVGVRQDPGNREGGPGIEA
jgi:hypothetical protein